MAENNVEPEPEWNQRALDTAEDTLVAIENLLATLRAFEDVLRQQDISIASSTEYCDNFCQDCRKLNKSLMNQSTVALMHYAGSRNSMDHGLPLLEVYCLSINCFASARSHLTAESDRVALVLKRLALSCFELFLSVPEHEIPFEAWLQFHQSVQLAHDMLLEYGSTDLQALLQMTGEGGAWCNPVLSSLLTGQPTNSEEVDAYISLEGDGFMEMRVKHLEKIGEVAKAVVLAKACAECNFISNKSNFRQTYVSLLCHLLPSEEAISEISRLDCKDVLEITCNLETEGDENTAFILCTTFLTQQLQQQSQYCSWELILLWSKLQRRLDPTLLSFLDRCLQLGAIAKTVNHLLYLVRVIQTEVEDLGVAQSVELCVKALQLPKQDDSDTRISVCKTISCLLTDDLEVGRACLLTEFLLSPNQEVFRSLEELYMRPDQKNDQENVVIPNSLRCELLLTLKSYWPFDPEFWDWKTLKHQCGSLLGLKPESEDEDEVDSQEKGKSTELQVTPGALGTQNGFTQVHKSNELNKQNCNLSEIQNPSKPKKSKFQCQICKRFVTDAQLVHHSKRHSQGSIHPCPVCLERFNSRKDLVPHLKHHTESAVPLNKNNVKAEQDQKHSDEDEDMEPGEINVDPSLMMYYKSTHDPDVLHHIVQQANSSKKHVDNDEHVTFDYIYRHYNLQNREEYSCPGTGCAKVFKHSKYLYVHLKSEHKGDENVKHFHKMRDKREKCAFCRKHFISAYHYRKHRKSHPDDQPYTCLVVGCGAQFKTSNELALHKQTHGYQLNYQCELKGCYVTYSDLGQIYHHEAEHFRDAAFTCTAPKCSKYYLSKTAFTEHLATHKIYFTEHDFEAQQKAKRKYFKSCANDTSACHIRPNNSLALNGELSTSHCNASLEQTENREAKTTLVAVCFDGSKFTCGFEKCGMTFSRARDVQRHLKCAHPEHLKMENKEHKHDRERGFKSKGVKMEIDGANKKGHKKSKVPFLHIKTKKEQKAFTHLKNPETSILHEALKEIVIGLCKLDLNCSSSQNEPPQLSPETAPPEKALHQATVEKPVVAVPQKKAVLTVESDTTHKSTSDMEEYHETLANAKPFRCDAKSCGFRTAKGYSLLRHYTNIHHRTIEQAKKLTSVRPYICDICSKSHREKDLLRNHYIQEHKISESQVDKMRCGSVHYDGSKTTERPVPHSQSLKSKEAKVQLGTDNEQSDSEAPDKEQQSMKVEQDNQQKEDSEAGTTHQGRSKRLGVKSNLCYILDKFNKPFHCVAKNCGAAFSTQAGLVRHLQVAHHYNRSQLLLENEGEEQSAESKKESPKKRPLPNSDEPQPQYKCQFANCHVSYHLKSSLARHTREYHSHPEVIRSKYEACTSAFNHDGEQKKHALYNHSEYYDSLVVRLQSTQKNSFTGCQKKLIVSGQSPQKDDPDTAHSQNAQSRLASEETEQSLELNQNERPERSAKSNKQRLSFNEFVFKSHEEALQMCQDRCLPEAYPCMMQDCDTVVQHRRSLRRHYINVHHMQRMAFDQKQNELVLNAEQLEEVIQRKSVRSTGVSCPNGVLKMEYQTESENSGDQPAPMSLHSIRTETQGEITPDSLGFPAEDEEEQPSVERNGVLVGADDVLYGEPSTDGHTEEPAVVTQNCQKREERLSLEQIKPFLRPVTVDLSPPSSLRFITEKGFVDLSNKDKAMIKEKLKNRRVSVSIPRIREPLKRKNDLSEQPSNVMDSVDNTSTKSLNITLYKPIGFESSFLNFINESVPKEKTVTSSKRQNSSRRSCSVKENNQLGIAHTRRRTHSPLLKSHAVSGVTSIQNLKLDKALAGCGDLAIKQLQYLKPVVVLYRPLCSTTLPDHYPSETNKSKLLLGS